MKVITLHKRIDIDELFSHLQQRLNPLFKEIAIPQLYEGALFQIAINGTELWITRSEHYVDDVNSLAIESILNQLFEDLSNGNGTDLVLEG
jgi:hypothetical protein